MLLSPFLHIPGFLWGVPSFVDKPATVGKEGSVDGVEDGKLSQSLHSEEQHETDNHKTEELEYMESAVQAVQALQALPFDAGSLSRTTLPGPPF